MLHVQTFPRLLLALIVWVAACGPATPAHPLESPTRETATKTQIPASPTLEKLSLPSATPLPARSTETVTPSTQPTGVTPKPQSQLEEQPSPSQPPTPASTITAYPTPRPAQVLELPPGVETILLLGTDREAPYAGRTDAILLVFLKTGGGGASLVSIPRDLYVFQPGVGMDRINTAYTTGKIPLLLDTIEYNFGVRPDHWALAHLDDFSHFIDDLGGLPIVVDKPVVEPWCQIPAGEVVVYGYAALCYVRSRNGVTDFERNRRQQLVLYAMFRRFLSLDALQQFPEWYERYRNTVHSDLGLVDLLAYIPVALNLERSNIYHYQIDWAQVEGWIVPETKAQVLIPKPGGMQQLLTEAVQDLQTQVE